MADFVADPVSPVDELANSAHASAVDLLSDVLGDLGSGAGPDPRSAAFLGQYAGAAGIGLVVMAFMAILALVQGMRSRHGRDDVAESLFKYLPLACFLIVFSPAAGVLLTEAAAAISGGVAKWSANGVHGMHERVTSFGSITADQLPGGAFAGVFVFLTMLLGAFGVLITSSIAKIGLPAAGVVAGMTWGLLVHPRWRPRAMRVPVLWLAVLGAKPLLLLMVGGVFSAVDESFTPGAKGTALLTALCLLSVSLIGCAALPFLVLRRVVSGPAAAAVAWSSPSLRVAGPPARVWMPVRNRPFTTTSAVRSGAIEQAYERSVRNRARDARWPEVRR